MNSPLANAFCTIRFANSTSCWGSAVEAITKSTGKSPPPGSAGGIMEMTRTPGILPRPAAASIWICEVFFRRSLQGLVTIPPKPPVGKVSWKVCWYSGNDL